MSVPPRRLALATLGLVGAILAAPAAAQTFGIIQRSDSILVCHLGERRPMDQRVSRGGSIAFEGTAEIDVVGLTFKQLDERLRQHGLVLDSVMRPIEDRVAPSDPARPRAGVPELRMNAAREGAAG